MDDELNRLIREVFREWKKDNVKVPTTHPDEEMLACFIEGRLSADEKAGLKAHLVDCQRCMGIVTAQIKARPQEDVAVPEELLTQVKKLIGDEVRAGFLEILARLKDEALELLHTTGDVIVGQELMPAPLLRARKIPDFKDEVTVLKDFKDIRVEVRIENKRGGVFAVMILAKDKVTQQPFKDIRITLIKDDVELESYVSEKGIVIFENVALGNYRVELSNLERTLASILLEIRK